MKNGIGIKTVVSFLTVGLLATAFAAANLRGQEGSLLSQGNFTLPFETRWGKAALPPGDYSFTVTPGLGNSVRVKIHGKQADSFVMAVEVDPCRECGGSDALIVLRQGNHRNVQALRLPSASLMLYYAPRTQVQEQLVRDSRSVERVPVLASKK